MRATICDRCGAVMRSEEEMYVIIVRSVKEKTEKCRFRIVDDCDLCDDCVDALKLWIKDKAGGGPEDHTPTSSPQPPAGTGQALPPSRDKFSTRRGEKERKAPIKRTKRGGKEQKITEERFRELAAKEMTVAEIAAAFGVTSQAVRGAVKRYGIDLPTMRTYRWTEEMTERMNELAAAGMINSEIAKEMGVSAATISRRRAKLKEESGYRKWNKETKPLLEDRFIDNMY
jgi:transposase